MSAILKRLTAIFIFSLAAACNSEPATTDKATTQVANTTADTALVRVQFQTSMGSFVASLDPVKAPVTVENFLRYVDEGFYNNTIFHRVINDFMVQGGGFNPDMQQKNPHEPIQNEANNGLQNTVGTLAMARTSAPHSATAQFFINVKDNVFLNHRAENHAGWGYAVFGEVTEGMETINAIKLVETGNHSHYQNVPVEPVIIQQVSRLSD